MVEVGRRRKSQKPAKAKPAAGAAVAGSPNSELWEVQFVILLVMCLLPVRTQIPTCLVLVSRCARVCCTTFKAAVLISRFHLLALRR